MNIKDLGINGWGVSALASEGIHDSDQLRERDLSEAEVLRMRGFGPKSLNELRGALAFYGLPPLSHPLKGSFILTQGEVEARRWAVERDGKPRIRVKMRRRGS